MIDNNTATIEDIINGNDLQFEFDKGNPDIVKIITKEGVESTVRKGDLFQFIFLVGNPEQQKALLPHELRVMTKYIRQHKVRVTKDIKAGDELVVDCEMLVPQVVQEGLWGVFKRKIANAQHTAVRKLQNLNRDVQSIKQKVGNNITSLISTALNKE